jgi:hypothetical protein
MAGKKKSDISYLTAILAVPYFLGKDELLLGI